MSTKEKPTKGFSYRFYLGSEESAVSIMFDVFVPGSVDNAAAVRSAKLILEERFNEEGDDFDNLSFGRIYFSPNKITEKMIEDVCEGSM